MADYQNLLELSKNMYNSSVKAGIIKENVLVEAKTGFITLFGCLSKIDPQEEDSIPYFPFVMQTGLITELVNGKLRTHVRSFTDFFNIYKENGCLTRTSKFIEEKIGSMEEVFSSHVLISLSNYAVNNLNYDMYKVTALDGIGNFKHLKELVWFLGRDATSKTGRFMSLKSFPEIANPQNLKNLEIVVEETGENCSKFLSELETLDRGRMIFYVDDLSSVALPALLKKPAEKGSKYTAFFDPFTGYPELTRNAYISRDVVLKFQTKQATFDEILDFNDRNNFKHAPVIIQVEQMKTEDYKAVKGMNPEFLFFVQSLV